MANEITMSLTLRVQNPAGSTTGFVENEQFSNSFNQNVLGADARIVSVPTSATSYSFTVTTYGFMYLQNLDATNYVTFGPDSSGTYVPFGKLKAGEIAFFRVQPGITYKMQANTAAVNVSYVLLND